MNIFKPLTARSLLRTLTETCKYWDSLTTDQKGSGEFINPDEPVVFSTTHPEFGDPDEEFYFHIMSYGSGSDMDEDGQECGHDGVELGGMEIDQDEFLYNGKRYNPQ